MSEDLLLTKTEAEIDILIDDPNEPPNNLNKEENFNDFVTPSSSSTTTGNKMVIEHNYMLNQYVNDYDRWHIGMDHCYARPWNWRPDTTFLRPTKTLFVKKAQINRRKSTNPLAPIQDFDDDIDVVTVNEENTSVYDKTKAKSVMEECGKHVALAKIDDRVEKWEEEVLRYNCPTITHQRLLRGMLTILDSDHLARLASIDTNHEAIERRVIIDKSVERVRKLLATISWETKYTQWLHQILIDNLTSNHLTSYLDILQTLKSKLPTFVDKMMSGTVSNRLLSYECLFPLLKRPWDPVASSLVQDKPKKLPGNPIILIVPSSPIASKRTVKWINLLSNLTTVISVPTNPNSSNHKTTMTNFVDQIFVMTRSKLQDIRNDYPGRNIVLFGFNYGATLALQIAQVEQVLCVICLGFSLLTAEGRRGEPDDNLLELQCPVLFIIGQRSSTSFQEDMEDLRERMRVETGLIIVGSADDNLRISKKLKKTEGITQSIVDRCIADEIGEFIGGIILSPYPPHIRQSPTDLTTDNGKKPTKNERKRYSSNTSSLDSEPPSPTPRITRPGPKNSSFIGRPPGSKSKSKLDTKFPQGTPSSNTTQSPLQPPTISTSISINSTNQLSSDQNDNDKIDTSQPPPLKKIKTLKPTVTRSIDKNTNSKGKSINFQNKSLSNLLQGDTITKSTNSGIRVLENIKFTNATFVSSSPSTLPSSSSPLTTTIKTSLLNTTKSTSGNQFILLPQDGKIKTLSPSTTTIKSPPPPPPPPPSGNSRFITSKRQLLGNEKVIKTIKKLPTTNVTLATNLTTEDIMDLPIIFADDNQILENNEQNQTLTTEQQETKSNITIANKFVVINKPITLQNANNLIIATTGSNQKKLTTITPSVQLSQQQIKMPPKYTKIILSTKQSTEDTKITEIEQEKCDNLTEKKQIEEVDLEKEIAASTVYKTGDVKMNIEEDCQPNKIIRLN